MVVHVVVVVDSVDVGVGRGGRERNSRGDLLHRLDLVLEWRSIRGPAGQRGTVGRGGVDGVQL